MNVVLIIILIAVVVLAAVSGAKHFKGQGGCCGGGGELRPEHKKLDGYKQNRRSFGESKSSQKRSGCFARQKN